MTSRDSFPDPYSFATPADQRRLLAGITAAARARAEAHPGHIDPGDWVDALIAETCEALWRAWRHRPRQTFTVGYVDRVISGVASSLIELVAQGKFHTRALAVSGTRKTARRLFRAQRDALIGRLGRDLTSREADDLAGRIRDQWPDPAHKPPIGFHLSHVPVSLDQHTPAPAPGLDAGLDAGCIEPALEELSRRVESAPTPLERRKLAVCLAWATLVPGAAYDHGLPAGRVGELEAWAHRPDAVRHGQTTHDQRLVEPFLPGRDAQIFTVYDTHPDYAHALFALAIDGLTPPA